MKDWYKYDSDWFFNGVVCHFNELDLQRKPSRHCIPLTVGAGVAAASQVAVAARAAAIVVAEAEAVGRTHGVVAGQVVHTRHVAFPGGHGWRGGCGGCGGDPSRVAAADKKKKTNIIFSFRHCSIQVFQRVQFLIEFFVSGVLSFPAN